MKKTDSMELGIKLQPPYSTFVREQLKEHEKMGFRPSVITVLRQALDLLMKRESHK